MSVLQVGINGFGRIGRAVYREISKRDDMQVVAINDLSDRKNLEYLLKYDSVYGTFPLSNFEDVSFLSERDPKRLPWGDMDIDIVVESTGIFRTKEKAHQHIEAGAKRVVISAPSSDAQTVLIGANDEKLETCKISSNGSCTTNATNPLISILDSAVGVKKAVLNTIHAYTATQHIVDGQNTKDFRRGRAAAVNIIPTTTGAAKAITKVYTQLDNKFDGLAIRVPVPAGSIVDITFVSSRKTSVEEVNTELEKAANTHESIWNGVFAVTNEPIVSTDILGSTYASIADLSMTRVVDGDLVKVLAWYDNETSYAHTIIEHMLRARKNL